VLNAIRREPIDRIPRYDSFWEDTLTAWRDQGMGETATPDELFDWDIVTMGIDASMRMPQRVVAEDEAFVTYTDRAGYTVRKMKGKSRALEWIEHVTKDKDVWRELRPRFAFDPEGEARVDTASYFAHMGPYPTWAEAKAQFDTLRATGKCVAFVVYGPWEATWRHRGYTELLMDVLTDPEWVTDMAAAQSDLVVACLDHCVGLGMKPDAVFVVDDLASTRGPLFSPDTWRQVFKPMYACLGRFLDQHDVSFWLHCCGACETFFDDLIECSLDVVQPLQARAGLDVRVLKQRYGHALTFWGNIDVTKLSGSAEECEAEVREKILGAKDGGGYMYHSDHSIPPEVSFERYRWIMDLVNQYGGYEP